MANDGRALGPGGLGEGPFEAWRLAERAADATVDVDTAWDAAMAAFAGLAPRRSTLATTTDRSQRSRTA